LISNNMKMPKLSPNCW